MTPFSISFAAPALLLSAALLAADAGAEVWVTVERCRWIHGHRVRYYPADYSATGIEMSYCGLTEVYTAEIEHLYSVTHFYLSSNRLVHINTAALRTAPAMTVLYLSYNEFREPPIFAAGSCSRLATLYLYNNRLTALADEGTFSACNNLKVLELSANQIEYIHADIFKFLVELEDLSLNVNKVKFIPKNMFKTNGKLKKLVLTGNRLTHLPPEFASILKSAATGLQYFYFSGNPWHCSCLVETMIDARRAGVTYVVSGSDWYAGSRFECVYSGAEPCCRRAPARLEDFSFHRNSWYCPCLVESIMEARRAGVVYSDVSHSYDGTRPVCMYRGAMRAVAGAGDARFNA